MKTNKVHVTRRGLRSLIMSEVRRLREAGPNGAMTRSVTNEIVAAVNGSIRRLADEVAEQLVDSDVIEEGEGPGFAAMIVEDVTKVVRDVVHDAEIQA
jgi:hypothetical protein